MSTPRLISAFWLNPIQAVALIVPVDRGNQPINPNHGFPMHRPSSSAGVLVCGSDDCTASVASEVNRRAPAAMQDWQSANRCHSMSALSQTATP